MKTHNQQIKIEPTDDMSLPINGKDYERISHLNIQDKMGDIGREQNKIM